MNAKKAVFAALAVYAILVYGSMAMMSIGAGLAGAAFLFSAVRDRTFSFKRDVLYSKLFWPTMVLSIACVWSLVWAKVSGLSYFGVSPDIHFAKDIAKLWHIWFPFILFSMMRDLNETQMIRLFRVWLGMGIAMAIFGVVQYHYPIYLPMMLPHVQYANYDPGTGLIALLKGKYHATGLTGFHLSFATIFAFPTGVWLAMTMLKIRRDGFVRNTKIMLVGCVLFLLTNMLTYSKTTWALIPVMILGFVMMGLKGRARWLTIAGVLALVLIGVNTSEFKMRFQGTDSMRERAVLWQANFSMISQFPYFGVGWHHNSDLSEAYYKAKNITASAYNQDRPFISHAHNNVLDQLSSTGLFGLTAWLWWNFIVLWMALKIYGAREAYAGRNYVYRAFALGALGGWFCLHVGGLTQTNFWDAKVMHQMGFIVALTLRFYSGLIVKEQG